MADVFKINDIDYECEFKLSNPDGQEIKFTKSAIRGMTIVDNVFEPFYSGTISIANPFDHMENELFIRGDGRDEFNIEFKPKEPKGKDEFFKHTFVIIDDSNSTKETTRAEAIKTFSLISKSAIKFMDTIPYGKKYSGKVGKILQDIFKETIGEDQVDKENWEEGDFEITNYCPPATFRYLDLMQYFLRLFYGKDGEIHVKGFITYDDVKEKYRLDLLSKVFSEHDNNAIEAFALGDLTSKIDTSNDNNPPNGPPVGEYIGSLKGIGYSIPLYNWTTDYFQNILVTGYDPILGEMKMRKIDFKDIKKKWEEKFVKVFKSVGGNPKPFAIENKTTEKRFKRYQLPFLIENSVKMVEAEIISNLTFLNLQVSFKNIGSTTRRAGKYMDIFTTRGNTNLKSDEKLLGRWLITEVRHTFYSDLYINELYGTKTYVGPKASFKEDVE